MSDAHTPPPLGYVPDPIRPHTVVIEFDVLARSQADADHLVAEVLIEDLAGDPATHRTEGARVFGEDFGDDVASIRSWIPSTEQPARAAAVPSAVWEPFEDSGIPEIVAEMFPPEPQRRDHLAADGALDVDGFADAYQQWRDGCLLLAAQAARLPELLDRLARAEAVRDGLIELVEREPLPVEPQKEDYLVPVAPSYEGEIVGAAYRWDHVQWQADFKAAARRRENALHGLLAEGGPRTTFLAGPVSQDWVTCGSARDPDAARPRGAGCC